VTTDRIPATRIGTATRAPKTGELVAGHLRRQIVRGELRPGETLPLEAELMEQYGVSRPTLREAFRILESETLISVRSGGLTYRFHELIMEGCGNNDLKTKPVVDLFS